MKRTCAVCRKERKPEQLQPGRALCIDRKKCLAIAATALVAGTKAQSAALILDSGRPA